MKNKPKDTQAVVAAQPAAPVPQNSNEVSATSLIAQAIDKGVPVDTLERLLAMRQQINKEEAERAFNDSMSAFQAECPVISKTSGVKTKSGATAYKYARIESIVTQVKDLITKHGFRYSTRQEYGKNGVGETTVKAVCRVVHKLGHVEETPMEVPLGSKTDIMSNSQVVAAASTFAKRYAFLNAFGIMTGDEDNDAQQEREDRPAPQRQGPPPIKVVPKQAPAPIKVLPKAAPKVEEQPPLGNEEIIDIEADIKEPPMLCEHCKKGGIDRDVHPATAALTKEETGMVLCDESLAAWRKAQATKQKEAATEVGKARMEVLNEYRKKIDAAKTVAQLDDIQGSMALDAKRLDAMLEGTIKGLINAKREELKCL